MTIGDTDVVPQDGPEPPHHRYGFLARLIGLPILEARLLDAIAATAADTAALEAARVTLTAADQTIDNIERT